ncbi:20693_t:CDS:2 [Rhizophagus irregularis]|nr:20693_t:CDS:2 [Rhizophagus irregularis]
MKSIKRFFSPNSSTSPSDPSKKSSRIFLRSNSGSAILDLTKEKSKNNTLHLDTNVHQYRHHSAANSPISYNLSYNTTPTTTSNSPIDSDSFYNYRPDEFIQQAIRFHEDNELEKATYYFKLAADKDSPLGLFLYGIALRHGWGCKSNPKLAVRYLQKAAESAVSDLHTTMAANPSIARVCFRHGWGVPKNKHTAAYYFEIAANLGDPDAQNDLGFCYANGEGVKKDMKKAAKYYRLAAAQGST